MRHMVEEFLVAFADAIDVGSPLRIALLRARIRLPASAMLAIGLAGLINVACEYLHFCSPGSENNLGRRKQNESFSPLLSYNRSSSLGQIMTSMQMKL